MEKRKERPAVRILRDILVGGSDDSVGGKLTATHMIAGESGKYEIVSLVVVLYFIVLIGLVGNAGNNAIRKIETQNAADSAAISSAMWIARGMNAITATNHILGELTALVVIHKAIGGDQVEKSKPYYSSKSSILNTLIKSASKLSSNYGFDKALINWVVKALTSDKARHKEGATIFDSKLVLKYRASAALRAKQVANFLRFLTTITTLTVVGIPFSVIAKVALAAVHIMASILLAKVLLEWYLLEFLGHGARLLVKPMAFVEDQVVPLVAQYSYAMVGEIPTDRNWRSLTFDKRKGPLELMIPDTLQHLSEGNRASLAASVPEHMLPVVVEPMPWTPGKGSNSFKPPVPSAMPNTQATWLRVILAILTSIDAVVSRVLAWVGWLKAGVEKFRREKTREPPPPLPLGIGPEAHGYDDNPAHKFFKQNTFDWESERSSQWMRSSYPWVDSIRGSIRNLFNSMLMLPVSRAGDWYTMWTDRYALWKSYEFRRGRTTGAPGTKRTRRPPLFMYIMKDRYDPKKVPQRGRYSLVTKGNEPWTNKPEEAYRMFSVLAFAHREGKALFSPYVYGEGLKAGHLAYAQAIVYNANEQVPASKKPAKKRKVQPNVGYDTLNWRSPVTAIEYDKEPSMGNSNLWPWQIFAALTSVPSPGIQLNWQAKLVPVTEKRLKDSMSLAPGARGRHFKWRPERLESGMKKALKAYYEGVILYTKDLDTH